jgi:hypothetical protein
MKQCIQQIGKSLETFGVPGIMTGGLDNQVLGGGVDTPIVELGSRN